MFEWLRTHLLVWLRVPPAPEPPSGAPGSVRVFRAGANFYKLRLLAWTLAQASSLAGIVISLWFFHGLGQDFLAARAQTRPTAPAPTTQPAPPASTPADDSPAPTPSAKSAKRTKSKDSARLFLTRLAERTPLWMFYGFALLETFALALFFAQLLVTYAALRLDFDQRWYIVTDRSLRLRSGVWQVQELTMSFANLQQVSISQGPLQRLLGLSDLRVQTAGGGGGDAHEGKQTSLHLAEFHGVENAAEIRDLILARLRLFRAAGLGDPEDHRHEQTVSPGPPAPAHPPVASAETLDAARALLAEARALRQALAS